MGLFNFLKDAGESISDFITGDGKTEEAITKRIKQLNLDIQHLEVEVNGERAIIKGTAKDNDAREKAILAAGNIKGISEVDAQISVEKTQASTQLASSQPNAAALASAFYQVKSGDTLSKISKQFYGDANRYNEIFKANQPMLSDPDKIYPGQTLRIPGASGNAAAA